MSRWLYSEKAFKLLQYCAWIVVAIAIFIASMATPWFWRLDAIPRADIPLRIFGGALGLAGGPAALIILCGMVSHCWRTEGSSAGAKIFWFVVFFATAPFGSVLYFFTVYRPEILAQASLVRGWVRN